MSETNISKIKNYLSMRISIQHSSYRYQYFNGTLGSEALEAYYKKKPGIIPARNLIAEEWNTNDFFSERSRLNQNEKSYVKTLSKEFKDKVREYQALESNILKQYIKMMKKSGNNIRITSPERYLNKVNDKKRIEIWTKIFRSAMGQNKKEKDPRYLTAQMLSIVEIDKKLWRNYAKRISLFSRGYFKGEKTQIGALTKIQKTFKSKDEMVRQKAFDDLKQAFEKALIQATGESFQQLAKKTAEDFTEALSYSKLGNTANSMKELIKETFDNHTAIFINEVKKQNSEIDIKQIDVIIDPNAKNPFLRYEIKNTSEYGDLISEQIQKGTNDFFSALSSAISSIETGQNYGYDTINNSKIFFTEEDKKIVLDYLKNNKQKLVNKIVLRIINNNGVISGEVGELQSFFELPIIGVVRGVEKVGQTNDFMDLVASFKVSENEWKNYGINVKRFTTQYNETTFQLYEEQNINYNNYKKYFTKKEIKLLNYLKANFQVIQEINKQIQPWNIDIKMPTDGESGVKGYFGNQWRNMLYTHLPELYRVSVPYQGLGVKTNLFFVVNGYYIPVSIIYKKIYEQFQNISKIKDSNDLIYSNIVGLKNGANNYRQYRDNKDYDATNLKITKTPKGTGDSFTARFQGFLLDLKELI